jgi:multiple sugar transport system permease protein
MGVKMGNENITLVVPAKDIKNHPKKKSVYSGMSAYLWILPSLVLILGIVVIPVIELFHTSFSKVSMAGIIGDFNNFKNYTSLFVDNTFLMVLWNTLIWTVSVVAISTVIAVALAILLNQEFHGRSVVRSAIIFPWATSLIITASMWKWIFDYNYGALNLILLKLHIIQHGIFWLSSASTSFPILIWVGIYVTVPFASFIFLAGLQAIPTTLYDAASIDGAGSWRRFVHITLPLLKQPLTVSTVLNVIYVFNSFPIVWTITRGDPLNETDTIVTYLYKQAFVLNRMGQAAAISVIGFIIMLIFSVIYLYFSMRGENDGN